MIRIPEIVVPGKRLGRHINHDPRSLSKPASGAANLRSVRHTRNVPVYDQGDVGSCTGNALAGCLSTSPFSWALTETDAVELYSAATKKDSIEGSYPPNDTGSSGLAVMQAAVDAKLIAGYTHAFDLSQALLALVLRPGIAGITWLTDCDTPDSNGLISYSGDARGGHEIMMQGLDVENGLIWFCNSWGTSWGLNGYCCMSFSDFSKALDDNGDATFPSII